MEFKPVYWKEDTLVGHKVETDDFIVFFGNAEGSEERLKELYPSLTFRFLKQVHGHALVSSKPESLEADGHFTDTSGVALCINTADCVPVMLVRENFIYALHCGWRGVEQKLAVVAREHDPSPIQQAFIGPHILYTHFEVGNDVAERLEKDYQGMVEARYRHPDPEKSYIDLSAIIQDQLQIEDDDDFIMLAHNTLTDEAYNSYRRDKKVARNISFMAFK
tara:strand:- start:227118 stop:227777 length:660 start_codon:yes stop_codon:yes gene_type:complete